MSPFPPSFRKPMYFVGNQLIKIVISMNTAMDEVGTVYMILMHKMDTSVTQVEPSVLMDVVGLMTDSVKH